MKDKYVEERFPRWFIFGTSGTICDLHDGDGDVFYGIEKRTADKIISARSAYVSALCEIFHADPDALYKYTGDPE